MSDKPKLTVILSSDQKALGSDLSNELRAIINGPKYNHLTVGQLIGALEMLKLHTGVRQMTDYKYTTYNTAQFHIPEGMYSIEEIEALLTHMKEAKKLQDEHLKAALQPLKEKNK